MTEILQSISFLLIVSFFLLFWDKLKINKIIYLLFLFISTASFYNSIKLKPTQMIPILFIPFQILFGFGVYFIISKNRKNYFIKEKKYNEEIKTLQEKLNEKNLKRDELFEEKERNSYILNQTYNLFIMAKNIVESICLTDFFYNITNFFSTNIKGCEVISISELENETLKILNISEKKYIDIIENVLKSNNILEYTTFQLSLPQEKVFTSYTLQTHRKLGALCIISTQEESKKILELSDQLIPLISLGFQRSLLYEEVSKLSRHDGLTNLYLKRHFLTLLHDEIKRISRFGGYFSILMLDIDNFKKVNDTYGHLIGDFVLENIAKKIKEVIRDVDIPARYGGEEFIVAFINLSKDASYEYAEKIRLNIEKSTFSIYSFNIKLTISGGLAIFPYDGSSIQEVIEKSDKALYKAKSSGKNCIIKYDETKIA